MSDNFSNYDTRYIEIWNFLCSTDEFELEETVTNELSDFSIIEYANSSKIEPSDERFGGVKFDDIDICYELVQDISGEKNEIENLSEKCSTFL